MANTMVAETILNQLGGNRFVAMTGAKKFFTNGNDMCCTIGRNASKANRLQIILDADDTYTMKFIKFTGERLNRKTLTYTPAKVETIKEINGVYCDQLEELFTDVTGMYTRL